MIKYIVIASGAQALFKQFSAIYTLVNNGFLDMNNVEKIYGTSAGACVALFLSLNIDLGEINNYLINRPWEKLYIVDTDTAISSYENNGIFSIDLLNKSFEPIFKLTKLKKDFTFKDIYEYSGKKLYFFATNSINLSSTEFSYDKTPDFSVLSAAYMSSSIPIIFKPIKYDDVFYIDGALSARFPMYEFIQDNSGCDLDEILGIDLYFGWNDTLDDSNILNFNIGLLNNIIKKFYKKNYSEKIKHILQISAVGGFSLNDFYTILKSKEKRIEYVESGKKDAEIFLNYMEHLITSV